MYWNLQPQAPKKSHCSIYFFGKRIPESKPICLVEFKRWLQLVDKLMPILLKSIYFIFKKSLLYNTLHTNINGWTNVTDFTFYSLRTIRIKIELSPTRYFWFNRLNCQNGDYWFKLLVVIYVIFCTYKVKIKRIKCNEKDDLLRYSVMFLDRKLAISWEWILNHYLFHFSIWPSEMRRLESFCQLNISVSL